ncbi:cytochrome c oxidase assembly factor 4 homolog, mitochondrial-like [Panonychus citri]|uniref:cytochrome c oxidase assembly factor 4 homolog, mitochondrial-like n=1 Tax=Panonychus citri TaxID=50023 RepID=UPI002306DFF2|nr:cytochrome c oxidase assembly factor 4 homolog, mitochondrial-like [Panonychus citri]
MSNHFKKDPAIERKEAEEEEDDPVTLAIKRTGCLQLHFDVQECIFETKDWRACKQQVASFKKCMTDYQNRSQKLENQQ